MYQTFCVFYLGVFPMHVVIVFKLGSRYETPNT
jgi:hypothetical protein